MIRPPRRRRAAHRFVLAGKVIGLVLLAACVGGGPGGAGAPAPVGAAPDLAALGDGRPDSSGGPPVGRAAIEALRFPPLRFEPPRPTQHELSNGIQVFILEDRTLPLVDLYASFRGGSVFFDRGDFAAASSMGALLLSGGTESLAPDSLDRVIEFYSLSPSFSTGGESAFSGIGTLSRHLDVALGVWADMLRRPRFDPERVEVWRRRELESLRRMDEQPTGIAIREFNRLLFGEHPVGWVMQPEDLEPDRLTPDRLRRVHSRIYCPDNMVLGVAGDVSAGEILEKLESAFGDWPPCAVPLEEPPPAEIGHAPGVLVIHRPVDQSTIVMGHAGGIARRDGQPYFAAQIANWLIGGGGLSSALMNRLRTAEGLAYTAWSVWVAGDTAQRVFGAFTQTKAETTIAAAQLVRETIENALVEPPSEDAVGLAVESSVNGFVFAFESPTSVVARQMSYRTSGLPDNWLERYLEGVQRVTPDAVLGVARRHLRPDEMVIVIVGDTTRFDASPDVLGPRIERR